MPASLSSPGSLSSTAQRSPSRWREGASWLVLVLLLAAWPIFQVHAASPGLVGPSKSVELSEDERAWLASNQTVRARVAEYPPYMFKHPKLEGISVDMLQAAAKRFGFKLEFLSDTTGFPAAVKDVAGPRQHYDLLLTFTRTPEREKQFAITADYLSAPWVIYARRDSPYIGGLESLAGKTVAAESGFVITKKLRTDFPEIRILEVDLTPDALLAVATGQADAYVGNLANASYLIKERRLDNLVVAAPTPYGINTQAMAVRSDWPQLATIITKSISSMTKEEIHAINQKWGIIEVRPRIDYTLVWQVFLVASLLFVSVLYWNHRRSSLILRASEARLSRAEEIANGGNWELHLAKNVIFASVGATRIYGLAPGQFDLKAVQSMVLPEYRAYLDAKLKNLVEHDAAYDVEFKVRTADTGAIKDIHGLATYDRTRNMIFGVIRDVTEQKKLQQEMERDASIIESSQDAIISKDLQGVVISWNRGATAMFGYTREEMLGKPLTILFPPDLQEEEGQILAKIQTGLKVEHFETMRLRKDGVLIDVSVTISPIYNDLGSVIGASKIARDISDAKRAAYALQSSEEFARTTIDAVPEHICVLDRAGTVIAVNRAWRDFYQQNIAISGVATYGVGANYLEICRCAQGPHSDDALAMEAGIRQVQAGSVETFTLEYPCDSPSEKRVFFARVVRFHGDSGNVLITHENITERRLRESELEEYRNRLEGMVDERTASLNAAKQAAEAANRAKSTFLATMSHELRTPMNAIMGLTQISKRKATDPQQIERFDKVLFASNQLLAIINDVLEISRLEADTVSLVQSEFLLNSSVEKINSIFAEEAKGKGLLLTTEIDPRLTGLTVQGDSLRLHQVLFKLTSNAIKFTAAGEVSIRAMLVEDHDSGCVVRFEVTDTGIGIPDEDQNRLFSAFEQLDQSYGRRYSGAGLGLAIAKRLVEAMQGTIGVASHFGKGSTFWVSVPLTKVS